jgi:hypothetical protein
MIGCQTVLGTKADKKSNFSPDIVYLVQTRFFASEVCVLAWKTQLRVNPAVAFYAANFNVSDVS